MAKHFIISAMEEVFGEYILNVSKENLKIAVVKGQINMENVQLDGDLIGSHILGAVGLNSFGVLSCSAKTVKISVPWKNLEKQPTKFEVRGLHLVCVPLTPSTANNMYGAGTALDPRCTLRTRAKRLVLARFERKFWNGHIPGEGPIMKRIQRAVKDAERDMKKKMRWRTPSNELNDDESGIDDVLESLATESVQQTAGEREFESDYSDIPELPRDWKVRLREKVLRNLEASINEVHVRCEVPECDFRLGKSTVDSPRSTPQRRKAKDDGLDRSFALGFTLGSMVVRTANENWEVGRHEKRSKVSSTGASSDDHLGPNPYVDYNNKMAFFNKCSIYCDQDPPFMLSETDALTGNYRKLSDDKILSRVSSNMEAMFTCQEPVGDIRYSLEEDKSPRRDTPEIPHQYICRELDFQIRVRTSDRELPGPISCSCDVPPFSFVFNLLPNQYIQYQRLKSAIKLQKRFDTMLRIRPSQSPKDNPRSWWKYAIACVTSRPSSRRWDDIKQIGQYRRRYIELVVKKNSKSTVAPGYHAGLSAKESAELLVIEAVLPLEALLAMHLVALRKSFEGQQRQSSSLKVGSSSVDKPKNRFRLRGSSKKKTEIQYLEMEDERQPPESSPTSPGEQSLQHVPGDKSGETTMSLLQAMTLRLGKKKWFVDWKLRDASVEVIIGRQRRDRPSLCLLVGASGRLRSFGLGKRDVSLYITQCEMLHGVEKVLSIDAAESDGFLEETDDLSDRSQIFDLGRISSLEEVSSRFLPDLHTPASFLDLPVPGTVCRLSAGKLNDCVKISMSAHPATLIWTTSLFDNVSEFFVDSTTSAQLHFAQQIRSAATPLARKAQLVLLSPASLSIHMNIAGPKVWVPLVSSNTDGTLFLDSGTLKMSGMKAVGEPDINWDVQANDIGVNFVHGMNPSRFGSDSHMYHYSIGKSTTGRWDATVVRPFSIDVSSQTEKDASAIGKGASGSELVRKTHILITPICLNLVDAEMLARSFGKWYGRGLHFVERRTATTEPPSEQNFNGDVSDDDVPGATKDFRRDIPQITTLHVEKIEMALEGHSKKSHGSDDRSLKSTDSLQEYDLQTRAYLIEVFQVSLKRSHLQNTVLNRLSVLDASIAMIRDVSAYTPFTSRKDTIDSENRILEKVPQNPADNYSIQTIDEDHCSLFSTGGGDQVSCDIFEASLIHNREAHLDEVEVDIDSVVLRVSPTTLKDCAKAFRRIAELARLVTKEMERKVHEEGRRARKQHKARDGGGSSVLGRESQSNLLERPISPAFSETMTTFTEVTTLEATRAAPPKVSLDSSFLIRIVVKNGTLLAGRPTSLSDHSAHTRNPSFAVIQALSNVLAMFQSIENPDATGTKTLHVSVDNVSALVTTQFERVPISRMPPMIEPTSAEFRIVYATESFGSVVSQDASLDCDRVRACMTPNDLSIMANISRTMFERLRAFGIRSSGVGSGRPGFANWIRYKKKGTGIATRIRAEIQSFSFVLLKAYKKQFGAPEFLDFNIDHVKGVLEGCVSALTGECTAMMSVSFLNSVVPGWEFVVEPFPLSLGVEQMPNELVLNVGPACPVQLNLTGFLLRGMADMRFDLSRDQIAMNSSDSSVLSASLLSIVGLRRATKAQSVTVDNRTGFDIHVVQENAPLSFDAGLVLKDSKTELYNVVSESNHNTTFAVKLAASSHDIVGERTAISKLPLNEDVPPRLSPLKPKQTFPVRRMSLSSPGDGSNSPESMFSQGLVLDSTYYNAEPVTEWCMQNQRLRSSVADVHSIAKGRDLLDCTTWSPEDDLNCTDMAFISGDRIAGIGSDRAVTSTSSYNQNKNWMRPYLSNDVPEWTDMTCMLSISRDCVMLPDSRWTWVNDWTVDISGALGEETDSDGWSYETEFECFSRRKRYYQRGDACRRRRWIRIRIVKPPPLNDPQRTLCVVWETKKMDDTGCYSVTVRSHVKIVNSTASELVFFAYTPSWEEDKYIGTCDAGKHLDVPVLYASAAYMRIGKSASTGKEVSLSECVYSDRFTVIPTGHTSSSFIRTSLDLKDVLGTTLHYQVELKSSNGIVDIIVDPVFRVKNLLPCQLWLQIGHITPKRKTKEGPSSRQKSACAGVTKTETLTVQSGKEDTCSAVSPFCRPHVSFRVPGYEWSAWKRIVNRKLDNTWQPSNAEEEWQFIPKEDKDSEDEVKFLVRFNRYSFEAGDPLILIMSVTAGHCPTISIYAQYWILDKTGFGCRFAEGFSDLLGTVPDQETSRRSYLPKEDKKHPRFSADTSVPGHHWSMGSCGMSLYFSERERLTLAIETGFDRGYKKKGLKSKWISPLDVSNVIPKTVFCVDEKNGPRRFELAIHVTMCPGLFARTKLINLLPRYRIVNLLHRELVIAQDGCLDDALVIPSQSSISFHWQKSSFAPSVLLGTPSVEERASGNYRKCWSSGRLQVDRVGITSLRLPVAEGRNDVPMVLQAEVRLATKDQPSAVVVVIWSGSEKGNPLYTLRNHTRHIILCRQPLQDDDAPVVGSESNEPLTFDVCTNDSDVGFECGGELGPIIRSFLGLDRIEEFVWVVKPQETLCFGFDDPEKPHILEWTYVVGSKPKFEKRLKKAVLEVDAMGSSSTLALPGGPQVKCQIRAEHSTKVVDFSESQEAPGSLYGSQLILQGRRNLSGILGQMDESTAEEDESVSISLRIDIPTLSISVVDNVDPTVYGREILLAQFERVFLSLSQTREGYQEFEARLMAFQADNHVYKSIHPVLLLCPRSDETEPLLHLSAVRRLQPNCSTYVFRYVAIRLLEIEIYLDRRTADTIAKFIQPILLLFQDSKDEPPDWLNKVTNRMEEDFARGDGAACWDLHIGKMIHTANSGRIYVEQLHLHPVRIGLTFTQEWIDSTTSFDTVMLFQFIRGMASIANAPLVFTSFVVGHVFESPQTLLRIIMTHYSSQLTKQVFGIVGSLAILGAPADFISNVGTGVRDFFYEPIQGAVHGPRQFIEGLEAGTQSLARGVFVGVVRGAANVAGAVNSNLAGLTADDDFIDERKAHQRMLADAMSRGHANRTFGDSLNLACASVARGVKSGALGILEQPSIYASKHGPVGFLKGVGKAVVGAVVKPVVGFGDGAVLVMNHMSDVTSTKQVMPKIPKRLRRALPSLSIDKPHCVKLASYDERAAKAQKIVTGGESIDDVYIGHINLASHLIIASEQCLWAIDRRSRDPWCVSWEEISHFGTTEADVRIIVFSQTGLKTYVFQVESPALAEEFHNLLSMQLSRMANVSELNSSLLDAKPESLSRHLIPGIKARQVNHVFGSYNNVRMRPGISIKDEIDLVETFHERIRSIDSSSSRFLKTLDEEAWSLVSQFGHIFSGLSSRRCIVASIINGTGGPIQIKSHKLLEGGSACYSLSNADYEEEQGVLHPGGVIIFFGWGVVPNLNIPGSVFMRIESNSFVADMADKKNDSTVMKNMPGYQVGFLEKSYDDSGWWAKYWLLIRNDDSD